MEQEIDWSRLPIKNATQMAERYEGMVGWEVLTYVAFGQALEGDMRAAEWLAKAAYGGKVDPIEKDPPIPIIPIMGDSVARINEENDQKTVD